MNLQTDSPRMDSLRMGAGKRIVMVVACFGILSASAAMLAQSSSSSSSSNISRTASAPQPAQQAAPPSWKDHWFFEGAAGGAIGGGLQVQQYMNAGWTAMAGAGYRVMRRLNINLEGNYFHNGMPTPVLQVLGTGSGSYNMLTFSANPEFYLFRGDKFGFYALGGGGYSHVATSLGSAVSSINCNSYSPLGYANFTNFCNGKITGSYSSNQPMYDFGIGFNAHLYPERHWVLFVETRYVRIMTPSNQLPGPNIGMVPIMGGIRW